MRSTLTMLLVLLVGRGVSADDHAAAAGGDGGAQARRVVEVVAERFTFTPSRIVVPAGTILEIRVRSADTSHGFHIVGGRNVVVPKRRFGEAVVVFEAAEPGEYRFECSKLCGAGHHFMTGEIIVTPGDPEGGDPERGDPEGDDAEAASARASAGAGAGR